MQPRYRSRFRIYNVKENINIFTRFIVTVHIIYFKRSVDEVRYWDQKDHPITKFASYLIKKGLWDETKEAEWKESSRKGVSY